jgi:hypothetical protein
MKLARPGQPARIAPWLNALTIGRQWGVGCTARAIAKLPGTYAGFNIRTVGTLKNCNLKKHEVSTFHIKAAKHMADAARPKVCLAPDVAKFHAVWKTVRGTNRADLADCKGLFRNKVRRIVYCLSEACRDINREFFRTACCVTLSQDGSASRQLARFTAANTSLCTRSGVLGMIRDAPAGHKGILWATEQFFERFATPRFGAALRPSAKPIGTTFDLTFNQHCRDIVHVWNTDAAAEDILSGKVAKTQVVLQRRTPHPAKHPVREPRQGTCEQKGCEETMVRRHVFEERV